MISAQANDNGTVDLVGKQGTSWELTIELFQDDDMTIPMNLNGYSARGQYRKDYKASSPILLDFDCSVLPLDGALNPSHNKVKISVLPAASSVVETYSGVYDIEIFNGEEMIERVMEGRLTISPEVTRNAEVPA